MFHMKLNGILQFTFYSKKTTVDKCLDKSVASEDHGNVKTFEKDFRDNVLCTYYNVKKNIF